MSNRITALILTFNEQKHIVRCIRSLEGLVDQVVVVDSGSSDSTVEICKEMGAEVYFHSWHNYSSQFNWGLENCDVRNDWCLRIDADEYLSEPLRQSIRENVIEAQVASDVTGLNMNRIMMFMGRPIRYGGCGNLYMLRLFRYGEGLCEERWMDEHISLKSGRIESLNGELIDDNLNNFGWWIAKHNNYATREAIDMLNVKYGFAPHNNRVSVVDGSQAGRKRWIKENMYARLPNGLRALVYFIWRYFLLLGFLDGRSGLVFHFFQGFWYRLLVDIKMKELEVRAEKIGIPMKEVIQNEYGFSVAQKNSN